MLLNQQTWEIPVYKIIILRNTAKINIFCFFPYQVDKIFNAQFCTIRKSYRSLGHLTKNVVIAQWNFFVCISYKTYVSCKCYIFEFNRNFEPQSSRLIRLKQWNIALEIILPILLFVHTIFWVKCNLSIYFDHWHFTWVVFSVTIFHLCISTFQVGICLWWKSIVRKMSKSKVWSKSSKVSSKCSIGELGSIGCRSWMDAQLFP